MLLIKKVIFQGLRGLSYKKAITDGVQPVTIGSELVFLSSLYPSLRANQLQKEPNQLHQGQNFPKQESLKFMQGTAVNLNEEPMAPAVDSLLKVLCKLTLTSV